MVDFTAFLQDRFARRVALLELAGTASQEPLYLASEHFVTRTGDTLPDTYFAGRLLGNPEFTRMLGGVFFNRPTAIGWTNFEVLNRDGGISSRLLEDWEGRAMTLKLGHPSWSYNDYGTVMQGVANNLESQAGGRVVCPVKDLTDELNIDIPTGRYTTGASLDEPIPLALGQIDNIEPRLVDEPNLIYGIADRAVDAITQVYDQGLPVAGFTDLGDGTFQLSQSPAGMITCDARGVTVGGVWQKTAGQLARYLLVEEAGLAAADIDQASLDLVDTFAPYTLGLYVRSTRSLISVLDAIFASVGGFWFRDRFGKFRAGVVDPPTLAITTHQLGDPAITGDVTTQRMGRQHAVTRLGRRQNWTVQEGGDLAGAVSEQRRQVLGREFDVLEAGDASMPGIVDEMFETLLVDASDAQAEIAHWHTRMSRQQWFYSMGAFAGPLTWGLGDYISLYSESGIVGGIGPILDTDGDQILDHESIPILGANRLQVVELRERLLSQDRGVVLWG